MHRCTELATKVLESTFNLSHQKRSELNLMYVAKETFFSSNFLQKIWSGDVEIFGKGKDYWLPSRSVLGNFPHENELIAQFSFLTNNHQLCWVCMVGVWWVFWGQLFIFSPNGSPPSALHFIRSPVHQFESCSVIKAILTQLSPTSFSATIVPHPPASQPTHSCPTKAFRKEPTSVN